MADTKVLTPLTVGEIARIAVDLQTYVGAQLQDCLQTEGEAGLGKIAF